MPEISLAVQQFNAPGVYIAQDFAGALPSGIVPFNTAYLIGEVSGTVSTSLTTGLPYNVPIQIVSFEDFLTRLGNGNPNSATIPAFGPALDTYNSVKLFFRNAASDAAASLFFVRVEPVAGCSLTILTPPQETTYTNEFGVLETRYGYPITINGFQLGTVIYDSLGNATHVGIEVDQAATAQTAAQVVLDAIVNSVLGASIYARFDSQNDTVIKLFPRAEEVAIDIDGNLCGTIATPINNTYYIITDVPANANSEPGDYVYAIENAFDFTVHQPGFLLAPAAFAKFNPEDRQRVGTAIENRVAAIDYQWFGIIDSAPADGTGIQQHYGYSLFDLADADASIGGNVSSGEPFFIRETQEFYTNNENASTDYIIGNGSPGLAGQEIQLPESFTNVTTYAAGTVLAVGDVVYGLVGTEARLFVVNTSFTVGPTLVAATTGSVIPPYPLFDYTDPDESVSGGAPRPGYIIGLTPQQELIINAGQKLVVDLPGLSTNVVTLVDGVNVLAHGDLIDGSQVNIAALGDPVVAGTAGDIYYVNAGFSTDAGFLAASLMNLYDPVDDGSNDATLVSEGLQLAAGTLINDNGVLYFIRSSVNQRTLDGIASEAINSNAVDAAIPVAYYQEWVRTNLLDPGPINLATYNPTNIDSIVLGARAIPYNAVNHDALAREHLMYTTAFGYIGYYAPYLVDIEGFNVPPSAAVAGTALRRYREQGFQEPPAGVLYPLQGVLRPQINITRAHQQTSNPTGLNAIRLLPNQGTVIWGARTRSSNSLFRWVNTRIILNVVINSLRVAFDDKIFRAIDGSQNLFRQIRGTAEGILYVLWQGQALYGASPQSAYRVIVNETNNPDFNLEDGKINVDVFVIPVSTLEVISIRVIRTAIGQLDIVVNNTGQLTGI